MVFVIQGNQGDIIKVDFHIARFLPTVFRNFLGKVAICVKKTYGRQGKAQITGFLEVVAGKHPQTTGIDHEGLM